VQFHWDRDGQANDNTSCWLRVATGWAGSAYGGIAIPRVGMEVLVTFLEGDPDQPLVTGCLFHKENVVPYDLPANKTRSTFKTLSSPGGNGYNEFRIEDKKGAEQIYLHAQRDWDDDQARAGSLLNSKKISERYDEQLKFVTRRGQPVKSVKAALIVPSESAPQISRSNADGLHPRVRTDAEEPVKAHLVWDEVVVPSGADDYEASRKK
jgi:uncharacterized protein involved in type VI secretion and phage assembly